MKLIDLNPRWVGYSSEFINGLTFDCPHCKIQRLGVNFKPPIDKANWVERGIVMPIGRLEWTRQGDTFETITLTPSINTASNKIEFPNHWHGFIQNGEVT